MKLPSFKRLYESDFAEENQELIKTLAASYNIDVENVYLALSKRVSLSDNIQCTIKEIEVKVNSNGIPTETISFKVDKEGGTQAVSKIIGCQILSAFNLTNANIFPTGTPFISYTQEEDVITIDHIAGLPANNSFQLTIVAYN